MRKIETTDEQIAKFTAVAAGMILSELGMTPDAKMLIDMKNSIIQDMEKSFDKIDVVFQEYIDACNADLN
jgi:hypothetical protein